MRDPDVVQEGQGRQYLRDETRRVEFAVLSVTYQVIEHLPASRQVHEEIVVIVVLVYVPQSRDVRMSSVLVYTKQRARFRPEERDGIGVTLRQPLEGHGFAGDDRFGGMDLAVRALAEHCL